MYREQALGVLYSAIVPHGILASPRHHDNYRKVWSRDGAMACMALLLEHDDAALQVLHNTVYSLGKQQSKTGQLPSNVDEHGKASYGGLAGRVDATTWWIISACWLMREDASTKTHLQPKVEAAFGVLDAWEMNGRGFVYTPLGGNWADEYISEGYVLYDQLLRYWAFRAYYHVTSAETWAQRAEALQQNIRYNYAFDHAPAGDEYHPTAYARADKSKWFWPMSFSPAGYECRWDMAANALAVMLGVNVQASNLSSAVIEFGKEIGHYVLPAFYPVIAEDDPKWWLLHTNYAYTYKNRPYHFHNGGAWPVFNGLLGLALAIQGHKEVAQLQLRDLEKCMNNVAAEQRFTEYWDIRDQSAGGVAPLCFSAAGYLWLNTAIHRPNNLNELLLW